MPLLARSLPVVDRCPGEVTLRAEGRGRSWCEHCTKPVHMLSELRLSEIRVLLAANVGRTICVSYRSDVDGVIATRREPARPMLAAALAGVAACTGYAEPAEPIAPEEALGSPIDGPAVPEAVQLDERVEPTEPVGVDVDPGSAESEGPATTAAQAPPPSPLARGPETDLNETRGALVVYATLSRISLVERRSDRLEFTPTKHLVKQARARWRAWRAGRRR